MHLNFTNKVAIVTGAGTGIGRATALLLAQSGAKVMLAGRRKKQLEMVAKEVDAIGGKALMMVTDVSKDQYVKALIDQTVSSFKRLDMAFNNAGVEGKFAPITNLTAEDFDHTIGINLKGVWLSIKYEMEAMLSLNCQGVIVNTSSWLAHGALPGSSLYSASKAGADGLIRAIALEAADKNIRINNINPGIIATPMLDRFGSGEHFQKPFKVHTPMHRIGTAEEVAEVVCWLFSDSARFITGQNLLIDGGYAIPGHR